LKAIVANSLEKHISKSNLKQPMLHLVQLYGSYPLQTLLNL